MWIYGRRAVLEALQEGTAQRLMLAHGLQPSATKALEQAAKQAGVDVERVPRHQLDRSLGTTSHQGVVAELPEVTLSRLEDAQALARERDEPLLLVVLDQIQDPRNYGAIVRAAEVLGAHGVVTDDRNSAPITAVVVKAAAGATAHLPLIRVTNLVRFLKQLKDEGAWVYGADAGDAVTPGQLDWDRPLAIVIGSEGHGMRRLVGEQCDAKVHIPSSGQVASLNASVAAGILLYAAQEGRRGT